MKKTVKCRYLSQSFESGIRLPPPAPTGQRQSLRKDAAGRHQDVFRFIPYDTGCGRDACRDKNQKHVESGTQLLRREALGEQQKGHDEHDISVPVHQMKCQLIRLGDAVLAGQGLPEEIVRFARRLVSAQCGGSRSGHFPADRLHLRRYRAVRVHQPKPKPNIMVISPLSQLTLASSGSSARQSFPAS